MGPEPRTLRTARYQGRRGDRSIFIVSQEHGLTGNSSNKGSSETGSSIGTSLLQFGQRLPASLGTRVASGAGQLEAREAQRSHLLHAAAGEVARA